VDKQVQLAPRNNTEASKNVLVPSSSSSSGVHCNTELAGKKYMPTVSSCAKWWFTESFRKNRCEVNNLSRAELTLLHFIPVLARQNEVTYANFYCAQCNIKNIVLKSLSFFNVTGFSAYKEKHDPNDLTYIYSAIAFVISRVHDPNVAVRFLRPENVTIDRYCVRTVNSCPENTTSVQKQQCSNHTAYRYMDEIVYKNKHCAVCNGVNETLLSCNKSSLTRPRLAVQEPDNLQIRFEQSKSAKVTEIHVRFFSVEGSETREIVNALFQNRHITHCLFKEENYTHLPQVCNKYQISQSVPKKFYFFREKNARQEEADDDDDYEWIVSTKLKSFLSTLPGKVFGVFFLLTVSSMWFWLVSNFCTIMFKST
jgi:hypothetical protein